MKSKHRILKSIGNCQLWEFLSCYFEDKLNVQNGPQQRKNAALVICLRCSEHLIREVDHEFLSLIIRKKQNKEIWTIFIHSASFDNLWLDKNNFAIEQEFFHSVNWKNIIDVCSYWIFIAKHSWGKLNFSIIDTRSLKKELLHRRWKWCKVMNFTWLFTMKSPYMKKWNHTNRASGLVFWRFECVNKKAASFSLTHPIYQKKYFFKLNKM